MAAFFNGEEPMLSCLTPNYKRLPISFSHGSGIWLWDNEGRKYLDALSGISVCNLGHVHPNVTSAIVQQSEQLVHTSNLYENSLQEELAQKLCDISDMSTVFFCNSGAEANEAAIKISRLIGHQRNINTPKIITMNNSFHGRTMATISANGQASTQQGFSPLLSGFIHAPFGDIEAIKAISDPEVVAIMLEPIQGEGGIHVANDEYLQALRKLCDKRNYLLIFDEIQCGLGRTGEWFAHQQAAITPDIITIAKGLGNGVPIGACMMNKSLSQILQPGTHGSTFGGNFLACSAGLAVLNTIEQDSLLVHVKAISERLFHQLDEALSNNPKVKTIRGRGLMVGIELTEDCTHLVELALQNGLLINVTQNNVIRLLPPFIIDDDACDTLVNILTQLICHES